MRILDKMNPDKIEREFLYLFFKEVTKEFFYKIIKKFLFQICQLCTCCAQPKPTCLPNIWVVECESIRDSTRKYQRVGWGAECECVVEFRGTLRQIKRKKEKKKKKEKREKENEKKGKRKKKEKEKRRKSQKGLTPTVLCTQAIPYLVAMMMMNE